MDPRGHTWQGSGPQYYPAAHPQRPRDGEDYHRPPHHGGAYYSPPDPKERERQWPPQDPRYGRYHASPPPRPDFIPGHSSTPHSRAGYGPDWPGPPSARPHSRQGYDYPSHNYWDYREDYGYYDHGYHRGYYGHPDVGQWPPQNVRSGPYNERSYEQDWSGTAYTEQYRYDQRRGSSQYDYKAPEAEASGETGEPPGEVYDTEALASSKASGLSSSSYELSQYINGAEHNEPLPQPHSEQATVPQVMAPLKFSLPHVVVSFGPAGQLVRVSPALASQGEPAQVELHSMEVILGDTQEQQEMRDFPGPLSREDLHKVDAITFALQRAEVCLKDETLQDAASAALLWNLLVLLCRQNGRIVGSDIAELLTQDSQSLGACEGATGPSDGRSLIDLSERPTPETETLDSADLLTGTATSSVTEESTEQALQNYTQLLLAGRKKEALESAMKSGLWGHALFLASKMDNRSYTTVLSRFTGSLALSDPLQTLFQLLSGRTPTVATCSGSDRWGDWKPHLAVMLSNETGDTTAQHKAIVTMGDSLASRGLLHAAHICYLTAQAPFGVYTNRAERLVLLGSSHSLPFKQFSQNPAVQCTEVFEYCRALGDSSFIIPTFQVYKFLYACRLLDCGLASQAFHYCEVVGKALLRLQEPCVVLLGEVVKLAERLKHSESQLSNTVDRPFQEPDWLLQLRYRLQMGSYGCSDPYQSPAEESAWAHEENRVCSDMDTVELPTSGVISTYGQSPHTPGIHYGGSEEGQFPHAAAPVEQVPQACAPQVPQAYAPVPSHNTQEPMLVAHSQHTAPAVAGKGPDAGPFSVATSQDHSLHFTNGSYHQTATLNPALSGTAGTGAEFYSGTPTMGVDNGVMPGGAEMEGPAPQDNKTMEQANIQPEKSPKSGWFSSWFKSKPKDIQKKANEDVSPAPVVKESMPTPAFSSPPLPNPMGCPGMLPSQPSSAGINPFSRKAGQQLGKTIGQHLGSMSQGP